MSDDPITVGHGRIDETLRRHWVMFGDDCPCEVCYLARKLKAAREETRELVSNCYALARNLDGGAMDEGEVIEALYELSRAEEVGDG